MKPEEILEKMPKDLDDFEKARYIYIELGKYYSYDEKYLIADSIEEKQIIFDKSIEDIKDNKAICSSISKIFVKLLNEANIKAEIVYEEGKFCGHMFTKLIINGREYRADLIHDLLDIKKGFKTKYFMKNLEYDKSFNEIEDKRLIDIDKKIGYSKNGIYMDDVINMLKEEMILLKDKSSNEAIALRRELGVADLTSKELLEYKINFVKNYFLGDELNCTDKAEYFQTILKEIVDYDEIESYDLSKFSCIDDDSKMRIFMVLKDKNIGENYIYTFSDTDYANRVDEEYIRVKLEKGMRPLSKRDDVKKELIKLSGSKILSEKQTSKELIDSAVKVSESIVTESMIIEQEKMTDCLEHKEKVDTKDKITI